MREDVSVGHGASGQGLDHSEDPGPVPELWFAGGCGAALSGVGAGMWV